MSLLSCQIGFALEASRLKVFMSPARSSQPTYLLHISVEAHRLDKSNFRSDGFGLFLGKEVGVWKKDTKMTWLFQMG